MLQRLTIYLRKFSAGYQNAIRPDTLGAAFLGEFVTA